MPCNSCKDVVLLEPDESGLNYTVSTDIVRGIDGQNYPIKSCLIPAPHRPRGGWKLEFNINGQLASVNGQSAKASIILAEQLFKLNDVPYTPLNLWFNANIQWIERAVDKYQRVKLHNMLEVAEAHAHPDQGVHQKPQYAVTEWGIPAFRMLATYLTTDHYSYERFLSLVEEVRSWMNPSENVLMGNSGYYIKLTLRVVELKDIPLYKQEEARRWLVETQNYLGISNDTYDNIAKLNHWN